MSPRCGLALGLLAAVLFSGASSARAETGAGPAEPVVVIDPGHGGEDAGLQLPDGPAEKQATLGWALALKSVLARRGWQAVFLTRGRDAAVPLSDRISFANRKSAAVFLSLHLADPERGRVPELQAFSGRLVEDRVLAKLAEREVEAQVHVIPAELAQNPFLRASQHLGKSLVQAWLARSPGTAVSAAAVRPGAPLSLLKGVHVPAVLVEIAPRGPGRGQSWDAPNLRLQIAERLADGLAAYLGRR